MFIIQVNGVVGMSATKNQQAVLHLGNGGASPPVTLPLNVLNRHGLIAGATGTGKTISLKIMAEQLCAQGVPVLVTDVKGDLSGMAVAGDIHPKVEERRETLELTDFNYTGYPTIIWDVLAKAGHPLRTTVSEMGPQLLSRLLGLNDTQDAILITLFHVADEEGLHLFNWEDLKALLAYAIDHAGDDGELFEEAGKLPKGSLQAIQRRVLAMEAEGASQLFGEPAIDLYNFLSPGQVHLFNAASLFNSPKLYAATMLWLLAELYETLPEVGDLPKPKLVVMIDEAHLLFADMPKALVNQVSRMVRLIRSKGVGLYFITQQPSDIPDEVIGQLGHRIQHALRVYSERDQDALNALVKGMPRHPELDLREVIPALGVGQALVSVLDEDGRPSLPVETTMWPPTSRMGPLTDSELDNVLKQSPYYVRYDTVIDSDSAKERLEQRLKQREAERQQQEADEDERQNVRQRREKRRWRGQDPMEAFIKSAVRSIGNQVGRQLIRGVLGALK